MNFATARFAAKALGETPANIGNGIRMALGLLCVIVAGICQHQLFFRSMTTGVLAHTALAAAIYERALHLTPAAPSPLEQRRLEPRYPRGRHPLPHHHPTLQERIMARQFVLRRRSMRWTDDPAKKVLEVIGAMRLVKYFCYVGSFFARIFDAFAECQLLRQPMMFLPRALSATVDGRNALQRLSIVFHAPLREGRSWFDFDLYEPVVILSTSFGATLTNSWHR
ncbi:hypothetical protein B0H16DRAFT_433778 [Mycena metata]|uniref:Uncharacterized protein n=1 Tax=Mycena metata TaxID=1033252 RepID=A0AAD7HDE3_9AGAR|nr:hypothetical protein B0H16DRAFT_433778 [Mycena metata]